MKFTPLHDRILVKRIEEKEQEKGRIIIPDTAKEEPMEGKWAREGSVMKNGICRLEGVLVAGGWEEFGRVTYLILQTDDDRRFRIDGRRGIGRELRPFLGKHVWVAGYRYTENAIAVRSYGFNLRPRIPRDEIGTGATR
jgi:hypothetical protein